MAVKKLSIALDPDVADAAASAAEISGQSLSAWLNDAARTRLRVEDGLAAVAEWEAEQGRLTAEERAVADRELDELMGRPLPHSA
jgi:predicted transcriptional regulator